MGIPCDPGSGEYDATGLIYFNARYYDPEIGRFLTEDPARQGTSWYSYCGNNSVNAVDRDGRYSMAQGELTGTHSGYGESVGTQLHGMGVSYDDYYNAVRGATNQTKGGNSTSAAAPLAAAALAFAVLPLPGSRIIAAGIAGIAAISSLLQFYGAKRGVDVLREHAKSPNMYAYWRGITDEDLNELLTQGWIDCHSTRRIHAMVNHLLGGRRPTPSFTVPGDLWQPMDDLANLHARNAQKHFSPFISLSSSQEAATYFARFHGPGVVIHVHTDRAVPNLLGLSVEDEFLIPMIIHGSEIVGVYTVSQNGTTLVPVKKK